MCFWLFFFFFNCIFNDMVLNMRSGNSKSYCNCLSLLNSDMIGENELFMLEKWQMI